MRHERRKKKRGREWDVCNGIEKNPRDSFRFVLGFFLSHLIRQTFAHDFIHFPVDRKSRKEKKTHKKS